MKRTILSMLLFLLGVGTTSAQQELDVLNDVLELLKGDNPFFEDEPLYFDSMTEACADVRVSCKGGGVVALNLHTEFLFGVLPAEIDDLPPLRKLDVRNNFLSEDLTMLSSDIEVLAKHNLIDNDLSEDNYFFHLQDIGADDVSKKGADNDEDTSIFKRVEQMPRFPGCEDIDGTKEKKSKCAGSKMLQFTYRNLFYPPEARAADIDGMTVIQFVIDEDGMIQNAKIVRELRDGGYKCGAAALTTVLKMNYMDDRWLCAKQRGRPVKILYTLPIRFKNI